MKTERSEKTWWFQEERKRMGGGGERERMRERGEQESSTHFQNRTFI